MPKKRLTYTKKTLFDVLNKTDFMRQCSNVNAVGDWDKESDTVSENNDVYFVNASRGDMLDFLFPEYSTFKELEYGVMMLEAMGYEINLISLEVDSE